MSKYKVIYDRDACIGAFACIAAAPDFWKFADDGKADLKQAKFNPETKKWELIITDKEYAEQKAASEVCPVGVITIEEIKD